ncbi:hypothetical protein N0V94_000810 [Neodidymelliopsis sp. IMI 364377]|nr:hypothetical protein N0V94_000810 [Neodidymelliopsis sp. IMI 364377]
MHIKSTLIAAALAASATADFVVVTAFPTPTDLSVILQLDSYISSLADYVTKAIATADPSLIAQKAKVQKELASFAATATYSIPSDVTALANIATFTTIPAWYSALPSDVKSYYDKENAIVESILYQAVGVNQTSGSGKATASGTGTAASQTGAATKVGVLGVGMAAAFLGVVAL